MKKTNLTLIFILIFSSMFAQIYSLKLWPNGAPNKNEPPGKEYMDAENGHVYNVSEAELFVYLPEGEKNTGAAVVICPGGGYWLEAIEHEGKMIAEYLQSMGVAGIVLKYRLPYGNHEIPIADGLQAMRFVRSKAEEWKINPEKIGIAGSSAGGHLATTIATQYDLGKNNAENPISGISSRPDFMLLLYPVVSFEDWVGHIGSRENLIGKAKNEELIKRFSNQLHVNEDTPPAFLILADDDTAVIPKNSVDFYLALKKHKIPAEMHIFQKGGHGFGIRKTGFPVDQWPELFVNWLKAMKIIQ